METMTFSGVPVMFDDPNEKRCYVIGPLTEDIPAHLMPLAWTAGIPPKIDQSPSPYWRNHTEEAND